jgi:hypothetical protein
MAWLLVTLTAWGLIAAVVAPVVGRMLTLDGRRPRRRPAADLPRLPVQRVLH